MPHTLVLSCLHALPVGLPDLGAAQKQSVASKQAAHLWASMRRCSTRGFSRFTTPLAHMLVLSCLYALPVRVPSATGHAKTECGEQAGGALVGVDEALQHARFQLLHDSIGSHAAAVMPACMLCLCECPVPLAMQRQSAESKQAARLWASMRRCRTRGFSRFTASLQPAALSLLDPVLSCLCVLSVDTAGCDCSQERSSLGSTGTRTWSTASGTASLPCKHSAPIMHQQLGTSSLSLRLGRLCPSAMGSCSGSWHQGIVQGFQHRLPSIHRGLSVPFISRCYTRALQGANATCISGMC